MIIARDARFGSAAGDNQGDHEYRQYSVHDHFSCLVQGFRDALDKVDFNSLIPLVRSRARLHYGDDQYCKGTDQQTDYEPQHDMSVFPLGHGGCGKAEDGP